MRWNIFQSAPVGVRGKYLEAQTLATEKVMAKTNSGMP